MKLTSKYLIVPINLQMQNKTIRLTAPDGRLVYDFTAFLDLLHPITPVLSLAAKYDNIMLIDLYAEPEGDTSGRGAWPTDRGTTWENMGTFLKTLGAACRRINPAWMLTASSGSGGYSTVSLMNDWGLDFIGSDIYRDTGEVEDPSNMYLSAPFMLGEFGPATKDNWDDTFQRDVAMLFYENARNAGYAGAFFWMYGYVGSPEALTLIDGNGELRPTALTFRQAALDRMYEKTAHSGPDTPAFMYFDSPDGVRFFGSRGADTYLLERSSDGQTWSTVVSFAATDTTYAYYDNMYRVPDAEAEAGVSYRYRVTVTGGEATAVSPPSAAVTKTVDA